MSKLTLTALVAAVLFCVPGLEAKAQGKLEVKARDGITVRDTRKAKLECNTYLMEGDKLREQRQYEKAIGKYQRAMELYPQEPDIYKHMGATYHLLGKFEQAESTLKRGTKMFPKDWLMWNNYAVVLLQMKKNDECKAALKQALALQPTGEKADGMRKTIKELESAKKTQ